jgi:hypothetical protein
MPIAEWNHLLLIHLLQKWLLLLNKVLELVLNKLNAAAGGK